MKSVLNRATLAKPSKETFMMRQRGAMSRADYKVPKAQL
jgi:hypothetical protein